MNNEGGGLYFIVGGLAVVVVGLLYFGGIIPHGHSGPSKTTTIEQTATPDSKSVTETTTTR